jgi:hypothetical protein
VVKNDSLEQITQCKICYSQYDSQFHVPLSLQCGHNICSVSVEKLLQQNAVECPFCKKISRYENKAQIPMNFSMLDIIRLYENQGVQISISLDMDLSKEAQIEEIIETIKEENARIEELFAEIKKRFDKIKSFNQDLIRSLEIFKAKTSVDGKRILKKHFDDQQKSKQHECNLGKCRATLQNFRQKVERITKTTRFVTFEDAKREIHGLTGSEKPALSLISPLRGEISYERLKKQNFILQDEVIQDYRSLCEKISGYIQKFGGTYRSNFVIKKQKNLDELIDIMKQEATLNRPQALNTLGFLYYNGIELGISRNLAFEYFKNSAKQGDISGTFACYCLSKTQDEKYDYLTNGILNNNPIMGTLGYLIETNRLDNAQVKNKIAALLYKAYAERGLPVSMNDYASVLEQGKGVDQNSDRAAEYYYRSMKAGYLEARKWLDQLYPSAENFRKKHPEYKVLESQNYEEYEN